MKRRALALRVVAAALAIGILPAIAACGESPQTTQAADEEAAVERSAVTGYAIGETPVLTEADANSGEPIELKVHIYDIGLPDRKGMEIHLSGDDASSLRWRMAEQPDTFNIEFFAVDGEPPLETDGLLGNPATAAKIVEFRGANRGETRAVFELVERDPAARTGEPAKRLEYQFEIVGSPGVGGDGFGLGGPRGGV